MSDSGNFEMLQYKTIIKKKGFSFLIDKDQIINERISKVLTQEQFSKICDVPLRTIQRIESNSKNKTVRIKTLGKLKKYFENKKIIESGNDI